MKNTENVDNLSLPVTESTSLGGTDLLVAADKQPQPVERRTARRKVKSDRRRSASLQVGMEVSHAGVTIAVIREVGGVSALETQKIYFGEDSGPSNADWSGSEVQEAVSTLAEKYRLSGQAVSVVLGGTPCVTRALFGENSAVDGDVAEIRGRADRYLSLGRGDKVSAYAETPIDAKRKRAWMTVAHRDVVEAVANAVSNAGMRLVRIEHSLVALSKAIGEQGLDRRAPILIVRQHTGRTEIAVSYRGELLLDYRPSSMDVETNDATIDDDLPLHIVAKQVKCIRRFLQPQTPRDAEDLDAVYFLGTLNPSDDARRLLYSEYGLMVRHLSHSDLLPDVTAGSEDNCGYDPLAATWIARDKPSLERASTDLMDSLRSNDSTSAKAMIATFWPVAAAIFFLVGLQGWAFVEQSRVVSAQASIDQMNPARLEFARTQNELSKIREFESNKELLLSKMPSPDWHNLLKFLGRALPEGAWLNDIKLDANANIKIVGGSFDEDAIYEYVQLLQNSGLFDYVTLEGTSATRFASGPAFEYEITSVASKRVQPASVAASNNDDTKRRLARVLHTKAGAGS